jgi:formiminotetrahydrofolate cyclodeaminase
VPIGEEKIGDFLDRLAGRMPAPGGGAAAALQVAMAAALLGMAARYTGGGDPGQEEAIGGIVTKLGELRAIALRLAEADTEALAAAAAACRLPASTAAEQDARAAAVTGALINLTWPSAKVISLAAMVVDIGGTLASASGPNLMAEVAAAAEAARAAVAIARINIEINLAGITDEQASLEMIAETGNAEHLIDRAGQLSDAVREQIRA